MSLKRRAVERLPAHGTFGTIELFDVAERGKEGEVFLLRDDSQLVVSTISRWGSDTTAIEYHNGRTIGGFARCGWIDETG